MLIGFLGNAGSGKDTAAEYLIKKHKFYAMALADPIKIYLQWMFGWEANKLFGPSELRNAEDPLYEFFRCPKCGEQSSKALLYSFEELEKAVRHNTPIRCPNYGCQHETPAAHWQANLSPRYALQSLGDWARALHKDAYINFLLHRISVVKWRIGLDPLWHAFDVSVRRQRNLRMHLETEAADNILITDIRFKNELACLKNSGIKVYRLYRNTQGATNVTSGIPEHASEKEQQTIKDADVDGVIYNTEGLKELYRRLDNIIATHRTVST